MWQKGHSYPPVYILPMVSWLFELDKCHKNPPSGVPKNQRTVQNTRFVSAGCNSPEMPHRKIPPRFGFAEWHAYRSKKVKQLTLVKHMKNITHMQDEENVTELENMDTDLHELFLSQLGDLHNAEKQLTKALPKMAKAAESDELKSAIEQHLHETEEHVARLEQLANTLDEKLPKKTCAAMEGLIKEGTEMVSEQKGKSAIDAAIIASAQKVEHYEIASYGTVRAWAEQMGHEEAVEILQQTLDEENAADEKLTEIAESIANERAQD